LRLSEKKSGGNSMKPILFFAANSKWQPSGNQAGYFLFNPKNNKGRSLRMDQLKRCNN